MTTPLTDQRTPADPDQVDRRSGQKQADRAEHERAERVVGADPRQRLLRDLPLHRGVPHDDEDVDRDAADERGNRGDRQRRAEPERQRQARPAGTSAARPAGSGRFGLARIATTTPTSMPTDSAPSTQDQPGRAAEPLVARRPDRARPKTAWNTIMTNEYCSTTTHSHCRDRNSCQPSRRSRSDRASRSAARRAGSAAPVAALGGRAGAATERSAADDRAADRR